MINKQVQDLAKSCIIDNIEISDLIQFYFYDFIQIVGDINNNIKIEMGTINEKNEILTIINELQIYYNKNIKNVDMSKIEEDFKNAICKQIKRLVILLIK